NNLYVGRSKNYIKLDQTAFHQDIWFKDNVKHTKINNIYPSIYKNIERALVCDLEIQTECMDALITRNKDYIQIDSSVVDIQEFKDRYEFNYKGLSVNTIVFFVWKEPETTKKRITRFKMRQELKLKIDFDANSISFINKMHTFNKIKILLLLDNKISIVKKINEGWQYICVESSNKIEQVGFFWTFPKLTFKIEFRTAIVYYIYDNILSTHGYPNDENSIIYSKKIILDFLTYNQSSYDDLYKSEIPFYLHASPFKKTKYNNIFDLKQCKLRII
ncbi:hypothetical protein HZS_5816, partial [Henneguya salminicola]